VLVLVTGATGFIGSNIARGLRAAGHRVRALARPLSRLDLVEGLDLEVVRGDILDPAGLSSAAGDVHAVVHAAAQMRGGSGWKDRTASHVLGTRNLLEASLSAGVRRFIYISSVAALGIPEAAFASSDDNAVLLDETHPWNAPAGLWPYGHAKFEAEQSVLKAATNGFAALSVNPSVVFGRGDRNLVSNALIWHAARGRLPPIIPGGVGVVHVEDVVEGTLAALDRGRSGERYILSGENLSVEALLHIVAGVAGVRQPRVHLSLRAARALAWATSLPARFGFGARPVMLELAGRYFYYNSQKARQELGVALRRPATEAIREAMEWYRGNSGQW
jgi:dihydroflavonol-4-reductase